MFVELFLGFALEIVLECLATSEGAKCHNQDKSEEMLSLSIHLRRLKVFRLPMT